MRKLLAICCILLSPSVGPARAAEPRPLDVAFTSRCDGSTQRYLLLLPPAMDKTKQHDLLIALHGHGSDRWQFVRSGRDECRAARDVAARHRMIFVSPDYRAKTSWMGPKAEADLVQIIGRLKREYRLGRVIISGGSMGGASSLTFAAMHPDLVDGVASMNGLANHVEYDRFQDAISRSFGGTKADVPDEYRRRSAEFQVKRLTMPIGLTTGGRDRSVPPASVLRLAAALKKLDRPVLLIHREDEGHRTNYADATAIFEFAVGKPKRAAPD